MEKRCICVDIRSCCFQMILIVMTLFSSINIFSQEKELPISFDKVSADDFKLPQSKIIDSNTNAVIIADIGSTSFVADKNGRWISYVFVRHTRIKIINKNAFHLATVKLYLFGKNEWQDKLINVQGSTYNIENDRLTETKLTLSDVFGDDANKYVSEKKFSMPNVKEGSIVEYAYTITSYHYFELPTWSFQHLKYPCLFSQLEIAIPDFLNYLIARNGIDSFTQIKQEKGYQSLYIGGSSGVGISTVVQKRKWAMRNVPAFKEENYINTPEDYLDKIEFHLIRAYNGAGIDSAANWKSTTQSLLWSNRFGAAITNENSSNLSNTLEKISPPDEVDYMDAAKHIYSYIRDHFTCVPNDEIYLDDDLYDVNKKKKGSVSELNLLMIALLRQKRINASPVILSTTDYGTSPASYPALYKMNYVICMMKMGGDTTFLDATHPLLGFGKLPLNCYNGHARIISELDSGSVFLYPDVVKEQKSTTVFILNDEKVKGQMSGSIESLPGYFESFEIRNAINKKGENDFFKNFQQSFGSDILADNIGLDSLNKLDYPVKIHCDFNFTIDNNQDIVYYNPIIQSSLKENPFKTEERKYPIEMPYPIDDIYVLNMEIPNGYVVDELPKSVKVAYNDNEGFFEYIIQKGENNVQLRTHIKLNRATFAADEYNALRDFFAYVVKKQEEQIVFKKKK
ncbi:MAG TPA: DUF3858 domain-containing protein [Puia sp.]|nr:DUF3858 domain-containing protein [Puia sp.]